MLKTYDEFVALVEKLGIFSFYGNFLQGFPKLQEMTEESQWHTGDPDTDPWQWKDRAAGERKLAFGAILGGYKGFISPKLYPYMVAAGRSEENIEARFSYGTVPRPVYELAKLFTPGVVLGTGDIRREMGVSKRKGASRTDRAVGTLQREFYITVCGNKRKIGKDGKEYGWPANTYCLVEDWAGEMLPVTLPGKTEAREFIYDHAADMTAEFDLDRLMVLLFGE